MFRDQHMRASYRLLSPNQVTFWIKLNNTSKRQKADTCDIGSAAAPEPPSCTQISLQSFSVFYDTSICISFFLFYWFPSLLLSGTHSSSFLLHSCASIVLNGKQELKQHHALNACRSVWSIDWWIDDTRKPRRRKNKNRRRRPTSSMIRTQQQTHTFCQLAPTIFVQTSHDDILFSMNEWDGCILLPKFLEFLLLSITYLLMLGRETTSRILNGSLFRTKEGEWRM